MAKRFVYFDINGLGEGVRYLLHYGEVKFEDVRYDNDDFPKHKATIPFGQLPIFEDGDKGILNQSLAIAQYVGQSLGLVAGDPWKDAQLLANALTVYDYLDKLRDWGRAATEEDHAAKKNVLLTQQLDFYFRRFETHLKANNGFFGGKLTWVDFIFLGAIEVSNLYLGINIESEYPTIKALVAKIHSYPGVKNYVAARKPYFYKSPFDSN